MLDWLKKAGSGVVSGFGGAVAATNLAAGSAMEGIVKVGGGLAYGSAGTLKNIGDLGYQTINDDDLWGSLEARAQSASSLLQAAGYDAYGTFAEGYNRALGQDTSAALALQEKAESLYAESDDYAQKSDDLMVDAKGNIRGYVDQAALDSAVHTERAAGIIADGAVDLTQAALYGELATPAVAFGFYDEFGGKPVIDGEEVSTTSMYIDAIHDLDKQKLGNYDGDEPTGLLGLPGASDQGKYILHWRDGYLPPVDQEDVSKVLNPPRPKEPIPSTPVLTARFSEQDWQEFSSGSWSGLVDGLIEMDPVLYGSARSGEGTIKGARGLETLYGMQLAVKQWLDVTRSRMPGSVKMARAYSDASDALAEAISYTEGIYQNLSAMGEDDFANREVGNAPLRRTARAIDIIERSYIV